MQAGVGGVTLNDEFLCMWVELCYTSVLMAGKRVSAGCKSPLRTRGLAGALGKWGFATSYLPFLQDENGSACHPRQWRGRAIEGSAWNAGRLENKCRWDAAFCPGCDHLRQGWAMKQCVIWKYLQSQNDLWIVRLRTHRPCIGKTVDMARTVPFLYDFWNHQIICVIRQSAWNNRIYQ